MEESGAQILPSEVIGPRKMEVKAQTDHFDCAVASIYAILSTLNKEVDYEVLRQRLGTDEKGTVDTSKIKNVFEEEGLKTEEFQRAGIAELEAALKEGSYCLIEYQAPDFPDYNHDVLHLKKEPRVGRSLNHGHYSVVFEKRGELIILMDPLIISEEETPCGTGIRAMFLNHFRQRWEFGGREPGWLLVVRRD